ncbi:FLRT1 protein, partial [Nyctiprogne leucopyga]|nr:FLRT1 protein [Nyctiprogne leucopyga]
LAWLRDWLRSREPQGLEVKGLLCQAPARLRGLAVGELRGEMDGCEGVGGRSGSTGGRSGSTGGRLGSTGGRSGSTVELKLFWVESAPGGSLRVRWAPAPPGVSLRLRWLRPGAASVTETLVPGERGEFVVGGLDPRGVYRVCLAPLDQPPLP